MISKQKPILSRSTALFPFPHLRFHATIRFLLLLRAHWCRCVYVCSHFFIRFLLSFYLSVCRNSIIIIFVRVCVCVCVFFLLINTSIRFPNDKKEKLFFLIHIYIECLFIFVFFQSLLVMEWKLSRNLDQTMYLCVCITKEWKIRSFLFAFFSLSLTTVCVCVCITNEFMWMCLFFFFFFPLFLSLCSFGDFLCCSDNKAYQWYHSFDLFNHSVHKK